MEQRRISQSGRHIPYVWNYCLLRCLFDRLDPGLVIGTSFEKMSDDADVEDPRALVVECLMMVRLQKNSREPKELRFEPGW